MENNPLLLCFIFVFKHIYGINGLRYSFQEILINFSYNDLSWDYSPSTEENGVGSFCIEYDTISNDGKHIANQLQIFSPQVKILWLFFCTILGEFRL